jgi:hypothetical protein
LTTAGKVPPKLPATSGLVSLSSWDRMVLKGLVPSRPSLSRQTFDRWLLSRASSSAACPPVSDSGPSRNDLQLTDVLKPGDQLHAACVVSRHVQLRSPYDAGRESSDAPTPCELKVSTK